MIRKKPVKGKKKRVKVTFVLPKDHSYGKISVVGDFNDWDPKSNRFIKRSNDTYSTSVEVEKGGRYAFRYFTRDGDWVNEEVADAYEHTSFGSTNCILET